MTFNLYYFSNSGGDLFLELIKKNNYSILQSIYKDPNEISLWNKSKNKKIVCVVDLKTQTELAYRNKDWLFKYYNEEIFFNNVLVRICKSISNNDQSVVIADIETLINYKNLDVKKKLLAEYSGVLKQIKNKDFALIYKEVAARFGVEINGKEYFIGYKHCVNISTADFVFDLNDMVNSYGEVIFSKLNLPYDKKICAEIVNNWKLKNYGKY